MFVQKKKDWNGWKIMMAEFGKEEKEGNLESK